ncbi:unnamed protein product [Prorocentrum cordatum]|uniref:Tubulin-specific chaperone A n=1 Tax=Prorocentrum cordatum TaxID=2364126 RepID=A0ABN9VIS6_9DINO|nr:unnamed protein product [Polarella glacialis]
MADYCHIILVAKNRPVVAPQVEADQAHRTIHKLDHELQAWADHFGDAAHAVEEQNAVVSSIPEEITKQEDTYKEAITQLHGKVAPLTLSLADVLSREGLDES